MGQKQFNSKWGTLNIVICSEQLTYKYVCGGMEIYEKNNTML